MRTRCARSLRCVIALVASLWLTSCWVFTFDPKSGNGGPGSAPDPSRRFWGARLSETVLLFPPPNAGWTTTDLNDFTLANPPWHELADLTNGTYDYYLLEWRWAPIPASRTSITLEVPGIMVGDRYLRIASVGYRTAGIGYETLRLRSGGGDYLMSVEITCWATGADPAYSFYLLCTPQ